MLVLETIFLTYSLFWIAVFAIVFLAAGVITTVYSNALFSTIVLSLFVLSVFYFSGIDISEMYNYPFEIFTIIASYFAIGVAYTIIWRWGEYISEKIPSIRRHFADYKYNDEFKSWLKGSSRNTDNSATTPLTSELEFEHYMNSKYYASKWSPSANKRILYVFIMMWPFDMFWELARKPIKYVFNYIVKNISLVLNSISNRIIAKNKNKIINK